MGWEELPENPFIDALDAPKVAPYTSGQRLARLGLLKGPSFGLLGRDVQAETLGEHAAEFAGSIPTIAASSALLSPVAGAAGLTGTAARMATAGGVGALIGGAESIAQGDLTQIPKEIALNVAGEAAFIGGGRLLRKLRPAKAEVPAVATPQQTKLAALTKATTTQVPETPPTPINFKEQLNLPTIEPQGELFPPSAGFGPKIDADSKSLAGVISKPYGRVSLDDYVQLADEYGQPINVAPETRYGVPGATQVDEFGLPQVSMEQTGPEGLARATSMFKSQPSRELGTQVVVPLTKEADDVVKVLMDAPSPRQTEMQFGADQIEFFSRAEGQGLKNRLNNVVPQRDAVKTSEVVKLPEADVERIANSETPVKVIESVILNKTKDGKHVELLGEKNGHTPAELSQMAREAEELVATMNLKGESKRLAFKLQMARIMKERCK